MIDKRTPPAPQERKVRTVGVCTQDKMARFFLSHSSQDKEFARRLDRELSQRGIEVWLDEREIGVGSDIRRKIEEGICKYDYFGIVLSRASIASPWVQRELSAAVVREIEGRNTTILPIRLEPVQIPALIASKRHADFHTDFGRGLSDLLAVLSTLSTRRIEVHAGREIWNVRRGLADKPSHIRQLSLAFDDSAPGEPPHCSSDWSLSILLEAVGDAEGATMAAAVSQGTLQKMIACVTESDVKSMTPKLIPRWFQLVDFAVKLLRKEHPRETESVGIKMGLVMQYGDRAYTACAGECSALASWHHEKGRAWSRLITNTECIVKSRDGCIAAPLGHLSTVRKEGRLTSFFRRRVGESGIVVRPHSTPLRKKGEFVLLTSHTLPSSEDWLATTVKALDGQSMRDIATWMCRQREPEYADTLVSALARYDDKY